ncbi:LamG-like jellyroll fold domain-containing protein [Streptacidiphilus sp. P02-A3a]|uniref:LamG-like jellyroll fold domain-containing protein n=1 Tax=Streptacidiphilus sp. P02-A3a TaxID=2704468 RepID=UPI0015F87D49|nr:LamG-like jellyroll fold domain-containing protein [Streptacidiphilus sp. P02-A3a]QMU68362.1 DNRLRE domain-containing protein [Streptacidiphilus sp. P02-A3a]
MKATPHVQLRRRTRARRILTAPLLAALIVSGAAYPSFADDGPANPGAIAPPADPGPVQSAQLQAAATGQPVAIPSLTTATTSIEANPDGSLTQTTDTLPVRVQQNGTWVPVDATLSLNSDGTLSPKATPTGVVLSGGGGGPLVTLTDPAGHSLSLTMPFTLPTPALSGDTALYPSVLPGVDLQVQIDQQGDFRDVLIVHSAAAAANPALATLQLAASAPGLNLAADPHGGMLATAADGSLAFSSPAPIMWDSSTGVASTSASASVQKTAAVRALTEGDADPDTSSAAGPGPGAQVDPIALTATDSTLTLTPDQSLLTGTTTEYPVFIDPQEVTDTTKYYTQVWQGCPSADTGWNTEEGNGTSAGEGIGYIQPSWAGNCGSGAEESYYVMDLSRIPSGSKVTQADLTLSETYGSDGGCTKWPVTVTVTNGINAPGSSNPTTWNNRPGSAGGAMAFSATDQMYSIDATQSCGGTNTAEFTLTNQVNAAQGGTLTFQIAGDESSSSTDYGHMRFAPNPYIQTTYDLAPSISPSSVNTSPPAVTVDANGNLTSASPACGSGTPGWIGLISTNYGASSLWMQSTATSPISGTTIAIWYGMVDNMLTDGSGNPKQVAYGNVAYASSPRVGSFQDTSTLQDGHQYSWNTQASDGTLTSNTVADCRFDVDLTPPNQATIASTDYPASGSGQTPPKYAGQAGQFTVTATDPAPDPSTCTLAKCLPASGIAGFRWSLDQPIPTAGFNYQAASGGQATIKNVTPTMWGSHILYVQAVDNAGNIQTIPSTYSFYAPWNPNTKVTAGDLTGDGIPDMLATDSTGDLILIPGNADPSTLTATIASTPSTSPDKQTDWNDYDIAHRGSLQNGGVDDLLAYDTANQQMYRYTNDGENGGTYGHFSLTSGVSTVAHPACTSGRCTGYNADWSGVKGLITPGDLAGNTTYTQANLITKELDGSGKQELWLYQTTNSAPLTNPVLLGTGDWSHFDLLAPGVVGGNLSSGTAGAPMLWARDKDSGIVYSFPLKDASGNIAQLAAPTAAPLTLGIKTTAGADLCAADPGDNAASGTAAIIWTCDNAPEQSMTFLTDHTVRVHSGLCLEATGVTQGNEVDLATCNSKATTQQWTAGANGWLVNSASGMCLADPAGNQSPDTQLIIWGCENVSAQDWGALTGGSLPTPLPTAPTELSPILTTAAYPTVASPGDSTGLGQPNLYATTPNGDIINYTGIAPTGAKANFGTPFTQGNYSTATNWWKLNDGNSSTAAADTNGGTNYTATLNGNANWTNDATRGTVLSLDGTTGYASTGANAPAVNTTGSYSVSAWVNLSTSYDPTKYYTALCQRDTTGARCGFYLQYSAAFKGWAFVAPNTDSTNASAYAHAGTNVTPKTGTWTHLVTVYDASSETMSLYVNGQLAGTGSNTSVWSADGPFLIGGADNTGTGGNGSQAAFPGQVSDVHVYNTALSPTAATTLNDNPPSISNLN